MLGCHISEIYGALDAAAFMPYVKRALAGENVTYERFGRMFPVQGVWRTVSMRPWRDANGQVVGVVTASLVVQELKRSAEALRLANERLALHLDNSPLTVLELDAHLQVLRCTPQITRMLGLHPDDLVGQPLLRALADHPGLEPLQAAFASLQSGQETRNRVESSHRHANGGRVHCEWFNSALRDTDGQVVSILAMVEDITLRVESAEQLRRFAMHDVLTGLPNRASIIDQLEACLQRSQRTHQPVAVLFVDLDGFKSVNDGFGHPSGDELLQEVARRLVQAVRVSDVVARWGGDEFVILLQTDVHEDVPARVCQRIFLALEAPCTFKNGQATVGASIGVAFHPPHAGSAADFLKAADTAMYEAKRAGKACVRFAGAAASAASPASGAMALEAPERL
jgi:diguanylate cyclase (GGDEF)-like protein/PAS domain S-box-containing protein